MDKFLIILLQQDLHIYKMNNNGEFEIFYVNGQERLKWQSDSYSTDFTNLKDGILDICNLDNLMQAGIDIVYHNVDAEVIKKISEIMPHCAWWQVFKFEKILPELLIKMKK